MIGNSPLAAMVLQFTATGAPRNATVVNSYCYWYERSAAGTVEGPATAAAFRGPERLVWYPGGKKAARRAGGQAAAEPCKKSNNTVRF
jgi:hypothetical protein